MFGNAFFKSYFTACRGAGQHIRAGFDSIAYYIMPCAAKIFHPVYFYYTRAVAFYIPPYSLRKLPNRIFQALWRNSQEL